MLKLNETMYSSSSIPQCWQTYHKLLKRFIRKQVSDEDIVNDLLQDVFYKVYTYCQRYEFSCEKAGITNLRSWLFQVTQNTVTDYFRSDKKCLGLEDITAVACSEQDTDIYKSIAVYVDPLLSCLPDKYRIPLSMDLRGIPQKEIAEKLNMALPAMKSRIQRSRQMVKDLIHTCFYLSLDSKGGLESFEVKPECNVLQQFIQLQTQKS